MGSSSAIYRWIRSQRGLLSNAGSLIGTNAVTSGLGFAYWWVAARSFPPAAVGLASAAISAMMLLGSFSLLGLGTLLIGELPRRPLEAASLVNTSAWVAGLAGLALGLLGALVAPYLAADLRPFAGNLTAIIVFAIGVAVSSVAFICDHATIGLLRGDLQLWRNTIFAAGKLALIIAAGLSARSLWALGGSGPVIYLTWLAGNVVSLLGLAALVWRPGGRRQTWRLQWGWLRLQKGSALSHHLLNLALQAPGLTLPIIVTAVLSSHLNASFYAAWMIVNFAFVVPTALSTVLYAVGAGDLTQVARKARLTIGLSLAAVVVLGGGLLLAAEPLMGLFGAEYAQDGTLCLRILSLATVPMIYKVHYVALCRVHRRISRAAWVMGVGGVLELALAAAGARVAGLAGLSAAWVAAVACEGLIVFGTVRKESAAQSGAAGSGAAGSRAAQTELGGSEGAGREPAAAPTGSEVAGPVPLKSSPVAGQRGRR